MKNIVACLCVMVVFSFCFVRIAQADEFSELKSEMKALQKKMQAIQKQHQNEIEILQTRIDALESARTARIRTPKEMEERVLALEERVKEPYRGSIFPLKGESWELGGELEFEFVNTQKHASVDESEGHFQLDKLMLIPKVDLTENIYLYGEIEFYSSSMLTKYIYTHFGNLPGKSFVRVGFDQRFMKPSRKTERYPLAGNSFWRDNSAGIFAGGEFDPLYWRFSYTNGYEADQRQVTEDNSFDMLHDNLKTSSYVSPGELGLGLGLKHQLEKLGKFDLLGFGYLGKMSAADELFLNANVTGYNSDKRGRHRYGVNLNYSLFGANLFSQFIKTKDGSLNRYSWYVQPSYKIKLGERKFFSAIEPLFRYGVLSTDIDEAVDDPLTWDREEFTFAIITDIYKNMKLKTEYTIDRMDKGIGGTKDYSEFIAQLEIKF